MTFTFQAGSSLHGALGVVVPHVNPAMCHMAIRQWQPLHKPVSQERNVPEAGRAAGGLAACRKVQWLLHRFLCLTVISGARL